MIAILIMLFHSVKMSSVVSAYCSPKKIKAFRIPVITHETGLRVLEFLENVNITLAR
jgi:hypothetical protein